MYREILASDLVFIVNQNTLITITSSHSFWTTSQPQTSFFTQASYYNDTKYMSLSPNDNEHYPSACNNM